MKKLVLAFAVAGLAGGAAALAGSAEMSSGRARHAGIVVVPHHPADNLGLNMLADAAMDRFGDFDVVQTSSFVRHDRRSARPRAPGR